METIVLHFVGPSVSRSAVGTCQVKQYSFGEKSGTKPPKALLRALNRLTNRLLALIDTCWRNATMSHLCPFSAIHFSLLTLSATHFLGGGEILGWESWGKE